MQIGICLHKKNAVLLRGIKHIPCLCGIQGERLFAEHMLALFKCRLDPCDVYIIRKRDIYSFNIIIIEKLGVAAVSLFKAEFLSESLSLFKTSPRYGIELTAFCKLHPGYSAASCDIGSTEYSPSYLFHNKSSLMFHLYVIINVPPLRMFLYIIADICPIIKYNRYCCKSGTYMV